MQLKSANRGAEATNEFSDYACRTGIGPRFSEGGGIKPKPPAACGVSPGLTWKTSPGLHVFDVPGCLNMLCRFMYIVGSPVSESKVGIIF